MGSNDYLDYTDHELDSIDAWAEQAECDDWCQCDGQDERMTPRDALIGLALGTLLALPWVAMLYVVQP